MVMAIKDITVKSVSELLERVDKLDPTQEWVFRGVSDVQTHRLLPSIGRTRHQSITKAITKTDEQRLLSKFRDQVRPHIGLRIENELEWLVLAQHHGLPTRLLDWTFSPIVAAYFAVKRISTMYFVGPNNKLDSRPVNGCVYAVVRPLKVGPTDREKPFDLDRIKLVDPPHVSDRVTRQVGVLTIHPTPKNAWTPEGTVRFIIPMGEKIEMKFKLDNLGVNEASMFPGVDAIANYLSWKTKWNRP